MCKAITRGIITIITGAFSLNLTAMPFPVSAKETVAIDTSKIDQGIVIIKEQEDTERTFKVIITKGDTEYRYDLDTEASLPLQSGNGLYQVAVYKNVTGNKYSTVLTDEIELKLEDDKEVFLQSNQMVNWDTQMKAVRKAGKLTAGLEADSEKMAVLYRYVTDNISYDEKKAETVEAGYVPSIEEIYRSRQGICYDYSALLASMLRSVGIPAKLVMGYTDHVDGYHAWNQAYLSDLEEWVTIDTTLDAGKGIDTLGKMIRDNKDYEVEKVY